MQITDLRIAIGKHSLLGMPMSLGVLTIATDEGIEGHAMFGAPGVDVAPQLVRTVKPMLIGRDPLQIGAIWQLLRARARSLDATVQGYVDIALWDILGKASGQPVHRLLGSARTRVPCYASSWVHESDETYVEEALAYRDQGFVGYKLHPPTQRRNFPVAGLIEDVPVRRDIETCAAVRDATGDDYALMLDAAWTYSYKEAVDAGLAIQDLEYHWYEDPLDAEDLHGYVRLKQHLSIPIVATEITGGGLSGLVPWIAAHATDALRGDVILKGGISGMMKIAALAEAYGLPCEIHDAYNALGNLATVHVAMAVPHCSMYEVLVPHEPGSYDLEHISRGLAEPIAIDHGHVVAPERPGLGIDVDWAQFRAV